MVTHIVSWGANERTIFPVVSSTKPSIVSIDSMLPCRRETSSIVQEAPHAAGSYAKHMSPLQIESSGRKTSTSSSTYSRADACDDSFIRHHKYFFKDGNITFLVRFGHDRDGGMHTSFTNQTVYRLIAHFTVSTNISFLGTLFTSPPDLTSSASVTMKPFLLLYH